MGRIRFPDIFIKIKLLFSQRISKWCNIDKGRKGVGGTEGSLPSFFMEDSASGKGKDYAGCIFQTPSTSLYSIVASFDISEDFDVSKDCRAVSSLMSSMVGLDDLGHLFQPKRFCFYDHLEEISHFGCLFP